MILCYHHLVAEQEAHCQKQGLDHSPHLRSGSDRQECPGAGRQGTPGYGPSAARREN